MGWFTKICRNTGLMIHNVIDPDNDKPQKKVLSKKVEEEKVNETTTLRRTTIEEVEVKRKKEEAS